MIFYESPVLEVLKGFLTYGMLPILVIHIALIVLLLYICRDDLKKNIRLDKRDLVYIFIIFVLFASSIFYLAENNRICLEFQDQGWYSLKIAKIMARTGRYQSSEFSVNGLGENPECAIYGFPSRMEGTPFVFLIAFLLIGPNVYINLWINLIFSLLFLITTYILMSFLTKNKEIGLITSITFLISPLFLVYSLSHENMISLFFLSLSLLFILISFRINKLYSYMLTFLIIGFAARIRPENTVLFAIFFILVFAFKRKLFKNKIFIKNISFALVLALILGVSFVMHVIFIPRFWGIEFMGPEYEGIHPFATGTFLENLIGHSSTFLEFNGEVIMILLVIGFVYSLSKHRKVLLLLIPSMIPYVLVYFFYAHGGYNYTYHLNFFLIPIAGMGIYLLYELIKLPSKHIPLKKDFILPVIFSIVVFLLLFTVSISRINSCKIGTVEFLDGMNEVSGKFRKNDIIVTGRDDFASVLNYLTESCVIYTAFTTDGIIIKQYEREEWGIIENFIANNENRVLYFMPKEDVTTNYYYYEGMLGKLSQVFDLEIIFENDVSKVYEIRNKQS
ncbi:MAG: hypothetical protein GTN76_07770 [Candidatus Aenigmarchaeota archaeon]|nr:hypothetical protein [Candidatus Aenigmarchaeota archaeon]